MAKNSRRKRLSENKRLFSESSYKYKNPDEDVPAIMLVNVTKDYSSKNNGETNSLKEVNITIKKGEFVFVIGDSGAGKSTLLKLLMREISPTKGKVYVNGLGRRRAWLQLKNPPPLQGEARSGRVPCVGCVAA